MPTTSHESQLITRSLSPAEMLGECFMPRLELSRFWAEPDYRSKAELAVLEHRVGGYCVFEGNPDQALGAIFILQGIALTSHGTPLLFSTDAEFGLPMRFSKGGTEFPDPMALAHTKNPRFSYDAGRAIAEEMAVIGYGWNFAPVADVNSNPINPIINTRAFGEHADIVSTYATEFMRGLQDFGIAACAKHFPGHGDTSVDSHTTLPSIISPRSRFDEVEFVPFRHLISNGVRSIMLAHIVTPELALSLGADEAESTLPSSLSHAIVTTLLRKEFGFDGIVVTDALEMRAIADNYGETEACLLAMNAGVDILLMPLDPDTTFEALRQKLDSGELLLATVQAAAQRIGRFKGMLTLDQPSRTGLLKLAELSVLHEALAQDIADRSLLVEGVQQVSVKDRSVIIVLDDRDRAKQRAKQFATAISRRGGIVQFVNKPEDITEDACANPNGTVIVSFHRARGYVDGRGEDNNVKSSLNRIAELLAATATSPSALILFGSPYLDSHFLGVVSPVAVVKTFSESAASVRAIIRLVIE